MRWNGRYYVRSFAGGKENWGVPTAGAALI